MSVEGMVSYHVPVESGKVTSIVSVDIPRDRVSKSYCVYFAPVSLTDEKDLQTRSHTGSGSCTHGVHPRIHLNSFSSLTGLIKICFLTMPLVVDEPLTRIELASRLTIYQKLNFSRLSRLY